MERPSRPDWLDDPDELRRLAEIREDVAAFGWSGLSVGEREGCPAFGYTVGLAGVGHPEFIVFGLSPRARHGLLQWFAQCVVAARRFVHGERYSDVVPDSEFAVRRVHERHFADHVGYAMWYHRVSGSQGELEVLQIVWPDEAGLFPWESDFDQRFANAQPDLSL